MTWRASSSVWRSCPPSWIRLSGFTSTAWAWVRAGAASKSAAAMDQSRRFWLSLLETPNLEVRRIDVLQDETEEGFYDFVARARSAAPSPGSQDSPGAHGQSGEDRRRVSFDRARYAARNCRRA